MSPTLPHALRATMVAAVLVSAHAAGGNPVVPDSAAPTGDEKATRDDYELSTAGTDAHVKVNAEGKFALVITPKNGKKIHPDAPLEVTFKPSKGVKPQKGKLGRADIVDKNAKEPRVVTSVRGEKAGATTMDADVSFFLCTDSWCQRMSDRISVAITVDP